MIWQEQKAPQPDTMGNEIVKTIASFLFVMLPKALWQILKRPWLWLPPALIAGIVFLVGPYIAIGFTIVIILGFAEWSYIGPKSFDYIVGHPLKRRMIRTFRYEIGWRSKMIDCGLNKVVKMRPDRYPKIKKIDSNIFRDRLLVKMVSGQKIKLYQDACEDLAEAYGVRDVRAKKAFPGHIWLIFMRIDILEDVIPAFDIPIEVDLENLPIGVTEEGDIWTVPATYSQGAHILAVATTGGGKSGVIWNMIRAMAPDIRDGKVHLWVCDPKGGAEFRRIRDMCRRYVEDDYTAILNFLKAAVEEMDARSRRQGTTDRMHVPTTEEPLIFIIIDEILSITAFETTARRLALQALISKLLTKGRSIGVTVAVCSQDATKQFLQIRQFFPRRWAGRLMEPIQVDMVLGDGARKKGARCDDPSLIPPTLPGVGFVMVDGEAEPVRTRTGHVTEDLIEEMVRNYSPPNVSSGKITEALNTPAGKTFEAVKLKRTNLNNSELQAWKRHYEKEIDQEVLVDEDPFLEEEKVVS